LADAWLRRSLAPTAPFTNLAFLLGEKEDDGEMLYMPMAAPFHGQPQVAPHTLIAGFAYYDADAGNAKLPPNLEEFMNSREAPVVFTLGSAAVLAAGDFYEVSAKAAMELGTRAVLLIGTDPRNKPATALPDSICVAEYAPYSALFSSAKLVVHQGGVGTTAQCLRAGKPMLIMPYSHDQPDNARRMKRLGVAKVIQKASYTPKKVTRKLRKMLDEPTLAQKASAIAEQLRHEDGVKTACDALEELYAKTRLATK